MSTACLDFKNKKHHGLWLKGVKVKIRGITHVSRKYMADITTDDKSRNGIKLNIKVESIHTGKDLLLVHPI